MKKVLFSILIFGIILGMSNCEDDDTVGLGGVPTPANIFSGGEWEVVNYKYITVYNEELKKFESIETDEIHYIKKLSFTKNKFSFYEMQDYPSFKHTYSGTYSLFYKDGIEKIKFVSDEAKMNGTAMYSFNNGEEYPDTLYFFGFGYNSLNGLYNKVN